MNTKFIAQKLSLATASVALLAIGTIDPATAASLYSITELPFSPSDINDLGQIVGSQYLWDNGTLTELGFLPGANATNAKGINNLGQVVGSSGVFGDHSTDRAFVWQNGIMSGLGTLPASTCPFCYYRVANDINDLGQVVGDVGTTQPYFLPSFLWANGTLIDLIGYYYSSANAINKVGKAVSQTGHLTSSAYIWHNGTLTMLDTLPTTGLFYATQGNDINNSDQVVGSDSAFQAGKFLGQALLWDGDSVIKLGNLGGNSSYARGINDATLVVGGSKINAETSHASLWEGGNVFDLNTLIPDNSGWELESASKINNNNQIIGIGKFQGESRGFLLTPEAASVPEPTSALGVLGLGGLGVGLRLWSQRKSIRD